MLRLFPPNRYEDIHVHNEKVRAIADAQVVVEAETSSPSQGEIRGRGKK